MSSITYTMTKLVLCDPGRLYSRLIEQPKPPPCRSMVTVALPSLSKNGSFKAFVLYGNIPDAVMVLPERVIATFFVDEMGEDSSLWTVPEEGDGEGKKDCTPEQPLTTVSDMTIAIMPKITRIFLLTPAPAY